MSSRDAILGRIKNQLSLKMSDDEIQARVPHTRTRLKKPKAGVLPKVPSTSNSSLINQFKKEAIEIQSTITVCERANVGDEIETYFKKNDLPSKFRMGDDKRVATLVAKLKKNTEILVGVSDGQDTVCVTHCEYGVAETGTLALVSGEHNPTSNNFLPTHHVVLLRQRDIVAHYEDVWKKLRVKYKGQKFPRTVNLVSGPSRSGDIEQKIILGAHGPTSLHIIIYK
ncbi:MAG: lactate utilization protein C [Nitratireductor sp.]